MGRKLASVVTEDLPVQVNSEPSRYLCVWIDKTPDEPHMLSSGVMRWDLRPSDWWEIWPELLAHPCAYLFAPTHPNRDGPPKFSDWVASWPKGLDWEKIVPQQFHERVRGILTTLPPPEQASATSDGGAVVRYAAPENAPRALAIDPPNEEAVMLRLLVKTLLGVSEAERENTARLLSTLVLAPDSARTLDALKTAIFKPKVLV